MQPFTQVVKGEMFLTYASNEDDARAAFVAHELSSDGRVRAQPMREPEEFRYTLAGETVTATLVGSSPQPEDTLTEEPIA